MHLCLFSLSLFLFETTSTGRGIRFWAWPDWPKTSWQRFLTSCYLTWRVEGSSPGRLCLLPLSLPVCQAAPRRAALPKRNARQSPRRRREVEAGDFFFFISRERRLSIFFLCVHVCVGTVCVGWGGTRGGWQQQIQRNTCQRRIHRRICCTGSKESAAFYKIKC